MRCRINVTERDIKTGLVGSSKSCPVALAIKRHIKNDAHVTVTSESTSIFNSTFDDYVASVHSGYVRSWISRFDEHYSVFPMRFYLNIPDQFHRSHNA